MNMADYLKKQSVTMGWRVDHSICSVRAQRGIKNQPRSAELPISPPSINPTPPGVTTRQQNLPWWHTEQLQFTQWHSSATHMKLTNNEGPSPTVGYLQKLKFYFWLSRGSILKRGQENEIKKCWSKQISWIYMDCTSWRFRMNLCDRTSMKI